MMEPRSLDQLINQQEPAWPLVLKWVREAQNHVEILPAERRRGERTLLELQITTRSPMGAIALEAEGILVDRGWLRLLGAGGDRLKRGLLHWNGLGDDSKGTPPQDACLVAHDAVGGFFAINGGGFAGETDGICYLAPDTLQWEDLEVGYSAFVEWCMMEKVAEFYEAFRWPGWEAEIASLQLDQGIHFHPPLWAQGEELALRSRRPVPMSELWGLHSTGCGK